MSRRAGGADLGRSGRGRERVGLDHAGAHVGSGAGAGRRDGHPLRDDRRGREQGGGGEQQRRRVRLGACYVDELRATAQIQSTRQVPAQGRPLAGHEVRVTISGPTHQGIHRDDGCDRRQNGEGVVDGRLGDQADAGSAPEVGLPAAGRSGGMARH
eukprot:scaffold462_cov195-Pinguiococcus_pyrenoidosus.AAC.86